MIEALYLHIPFCTSRCSYCDFSTSACHDGKAMDTYVDALVLQLRRASKAGLLGAVRTIYIGGGTPTHLGARRLNSLVYAISLSVNLEQVIEFTVEANPESLDERMVKDLYALGVSRLSIGAQSFDDDVLRTFGRAHDAQAIAAAVQAAKARDLDVSLDLICGACNQTSGSWRASVAAALALGIDHVSIYPLAIEEGTPLAAQVDAGEIPLPSDDAEAEMMVAAEELLIAAGFRRYEVASYARPGHEAKHNCAYWQGIEYLGLGAGASSMFSADTWGLCSTAGIFGDVAQTTDAHGHAVAGADTIASDARIRATATFDTGAYSETLGRPILELEVLSYREAVLEDAMLAFRMSVGLSARSHKDAIEAVPELEPVLELLQVERLISPSGQDACAGCSALVPTERGWLMGNEIFSAIWDLA